MRDDAATRRLWLSLSKLLDYPDQRTPGIARECASLVALDSSKAAELLLQFAGSAESLAPGELEEEYTRAFELNSEASLYVGYHLFGESYRRSLFLLGLKERYQACGLETGSELPDHLAIILRYLARSGDREEDNELVREAVLPALDKLLPPTTTADEGEGEAVSGIYYPVIASLRRILADSVTPSLSEGMLAPAGRTVP